MAFERYSSRFIGVYVETQCISGGGQHQHVLIPSRRSLFSFRLVSRGAHIFFTNIIDGGSRKDDIHAARCLRKVYSIQAEVYCLFPGLQCSEYSHRNLSTWAVLVGGGNCASECHSGCLYAEPREDKDQSMYVYINVASPLQDHPLRPLYASSSRWLVVRTVSCAPYAFSD